MRRALVARAPCAPGVDRVPRAGRRHADHPRRPARGAAARAGSARRARSRREPAQPRRRARSRHEGRRAARRARARSGRPGDLVLENAEVVFVVDQLGSQRRRRRGGGNLVDAADAHARKDELGQVCRRTSGPPRRQGVYDAVTTGTETDGSAWIEARGQALAEARLAVTTRYTLHAPDRALLLETTRREHRRRAARRCRRSATRSQWGSAEKVAPGKPRGFVGPTSGAYVGGVGPLHELRRHLDRGHHRRRQRQRRRRDTVAAQGREARRRTSKTHVRARLRRRRAAGHVEPRRASSRWPRGSRSGEVKLDVASAAPGGDASRSIA